MRYLGFSGKRIVLLLVATFVCSLANAVPAKREMWQHITLADGTKVVAELRGDEHGKFWADSDGNAYMKNEQGEFVKMTLQKATATIARNRQIREDTMMKSIPSRAPRRVNGIPTDKSIFQGKKKGIIILVQFPEGTFTQGNFTVPDPAVSFSDETPALLGCSNSQELYQKIINQRNLKDDPNRGPFTGSVKDYFIDQSYGQFELDFDIAGPYTLSKSHHYYGQNNTRSSDSHAGEMVYEAVNLAISNGVDFSLYDWNGDNTVDQVFVLFAGQGEADGGEEDCIWPHEYYLSYAYKTVKTTINGKIITINQYACSNELATNKHYGKTDDEDFVYGTQINGIGTICHEFSHCLGFPDMYDIADQNFGMGKWDLMDEGNYNGKWNGGHEDWEDRAAGYEPAGYTAFEKWCAGWIEPIELTDPQKITHLKPIGGTQEGGPNDHGDAYVIYMPESNKNIEGEYYILENRQQSNWDASLPWHGLLITYIHYDQNLWRNNCLNCTDPATLQERRASNDHRRITIFQAGGNDPGFLSLDVYPYKTDFVTEIGGNKWGSDAIASINYLNSTYGVKGLNLSTEDCDELSSSSTPNAYYWGKNTSAQVLTDHDIWQIAPENDGECMSFIYRKLANEKVLQLDQDTEEIQELEKGLYSSVTLNRQFTKGIYNTLWLPFDMNKKEFISNFGEGSQIYRLTDVTADDNGKIVINITEDTQNGIKAYEPIFIKLGEDVENSSLQINDYMQINENPTEKEPTITLENGWKLVGTKSHGYVPANAKYLKDNKYYTAQANKTIIRAYRAYLMAPDDSDIETGNAKDVVFNIVNQDPNDTDFIATSILKPAEDGNIYDLTGRRIEGNYLPKGIYIQNGKKFVVK